MIFSIDPTLTSDEMIRQLLGFSCGKPLGYNDVEVSLPFKSFEDPSGTNTEIHITRKSGSVNIKPGGPSTIIRRYRRLELNYFCGILHPAESRTFALMEPTLDNFNRMFHSKLVPGDADIKVKYYPDGTRETVVSMSENHYGLFGAYGFSRDPDGKEKVSIKDAFSGLMPGFSGAKMTTPVSLSIFDGMTL